VKNKLAEFRSAEKNAEGTALKTRVERGHLRTPMRYSQNQWCQQSAGLSWIAVRDGL